MAAAQAPCATASPISRYEMPSFVMVLRNTQAWSAAAAIANSQNASRIRPKRASTLVALVTTNGSKVTVAMMRLRMNGQEHKGAEFGRGMFWLDWHVPVRGRRRQTG